MRFKDLDELARRTRPPRSGTHLRPAPLRAAGAPSALYAGIA